MTRDRRSAEVPVVASCRPGGPLPVGMRVATFVPTARPFGDGHAVSCYEVRSHDAQLTSVDCVAPTWHRLSGVCTHTPGRASG